ncbi:hypothetical protein ACFYWU_10795 [Streptomyces chrestomyceticus]|uniref:hypothetical protein n=1 Tax=Streptomyces chrestomyceticus TaxID=68185 RepID=UPI0036AC109B
MSQGRPRGGPVGLDPRHVGVLLCRCGQDTVKLPGLSEGLCLRCYGAERSAYERRMANGNHRGVAANVAGDTCMACEGDDVDADGCLWWCNHCHIVMRVAYPAPYPGLPRPKGHPAWLR